jgi:hypothetical protein
VPREREREEGKEEGIKNSRNLCHLAALQNLDLDLKKKLRNPMKNQIKIRISLERNRMDDQIERKVTNFCCPFS